MTSSDAHRPDARAEEFLRLLGKHEARINALILAMVPDWAAAEDIGQEVRIRLWKAFDQYDPSKDFGPWCRTIAYHEVLRYIKQTKRRHPAFSPEFFETVADQMARMPDDYNDRLRALSACLRKLAEFKRRLLMRYYAGNETMHEIAERIGRSFDATRQSILRSRKSVGECVKKTLREGASGE